MSYKNNPILYTATVLSPADFRVSTFMLGAFVFLRLSSAHAQPSSHFQPGLRFGHAPWVFAVARLSLLSLILAWSPARELFRFGPLHANDLIATLTAPAPNPTALKRTCAKSRAARLALRYAYYKGVQICSSSTMI